MLFCALYSGIFQISKVVWNRNFRLHFQRNLLYTVVFLALKSLSEQYHHYRFSKGSDRPVWRVR